MYPSHYFSIHSRREESNRRRGLGFKTADGGGGGEVLRNSSCPCEGCDCYTESRPAQPGQEQDGNRRRDGWEDGKWKLLIDFLLRDGKDSTPFCLGGHRSIYGVRDIIWINTIHISNVSDFSVVCVSLFCVRERSVSRLLSESAGTWPLQTERCPWDLTGDTRLCHGGQGEI